ncbi:MAG TPA: OmpH family outer membrane protein [Phycisphaerales bacterium]|nr:OmpH family outer membrane protein [Phycisphaerales bacterium]
MRATRLGAAVLGLVAAMFVGGVASAAPQALPFAVIDINKVLNKLDEKTDRENELKTYIKQLGDTIEGTQKELDVEQGNLKILPANTPQFDESKEKVVRLTAKVRLDREMSNALVEDRQTRMQLALFNKIQSATQRLAKKDGYAMVIADDSKTDIPPAAQPDRIQAAMVNRRVVYADAAVDISDQVANLMNNEYKAGGGAAGAKATDAKPADAKNATPAKPK